MECRFTAHVSLGQGFNFDLKGEVFDYVEKGKVKSGIRIDPIEVDADHKEDFKILLGNINVKIMQQVELYKVNPEQSVFGTPYRQKEFKVSVVPDEKLGALITLSKQVRN